MKPCECGAPGAYDYTSAEGDYSLCEECYLVAERQRNYVPSDSTDSDFP